MQGACSRTFWALGGAQRGAGPTSSEQYDSPPLTSVLVVWRISLRSSCFSQSRPCFHIRPRESLLSVVRYNGGPGRRPTRRGPGSARAHCRRQGASVEPPPPRVTLLLRAAEGSPETGVGATVRAAGPAAHNMQGFMDLNTGGYGSHFSFTPPPGARRTPEMTHTTGNRHGSWLTRRTSTSPGG